MAKTSLTYEQQGLVDELVRTGMFETAEDAVTAGLQLLKRVMQDDAIQIEQLEAEIDAGLASGPATAMESADVLLAQFRQRVS